MHGAILGCVDLLLLLMVLMLQFHSVDIIAAHDMSYVGILF